MGYLICSKCKSYYELQSDESRKDFVDVCDCGGKLRYVENLDIVDPNWKQVSINRKNTKMEIIRNKLQSVFSIGRKDIKDRLVQFYYKTFGKWIYKIQNRNRIHRNSYGTPYGMDIGFINSIKNELNFNNIRWILVIPVVMAITVILTFAQSILSLLIFILLAAVGYLFEDRIIGTKNAVVAGAISFFLGSLFTGSFLYLIPFTILGVINGVICGWIGGYLRTKI